MNKPLLSLFLVVVLSFVFLAGCTGNTKIAKSNLNKGNLSSPGTSSQVGNEMGNHTTANPNNSIKTGDENTNIENNPKIIGVEGILAILSGNIYTINFKLLDSNGSHVGVDGAVQIILKDSAGETLYNGTVNIQKEDVGIMGYEIKIPLSDIEKSATTEEYGGTLELVVTTKDNQTVSVTTSNVEIPVMSPEEVFEKYNKEYQSTAKTSQASITKNEITFKIKKYGFILLPEFGSSGELKKFFRVDIEIDNNRNDEISLTMSPKLIYNHKQYDDLASGFGEFPGMCDAFSEDISSGVSKECYILFKNVPEGITDDFTLEVGKEFSQYTNYDTVKYSIQNK